MAEPDWDNSHQWNEFEWEQALKNSEESSARFFRLLERFGDMPDAEQLISKSIGEDLHFRDEDESFLSDLDDWKNDDFDIESYSSDEEDPLQPGDGLFYETFPVYQKARMVALGWCNILASELSPEDRFWGLKVLFHLGRVLSYLSLSIGDGTFDRIEGNIAFAKRGLKEINEVLGQLQEKQTENKRYETMCKCIRDLLLELHDLAVAHLLELRKRKNEMDV